MFINDGNEKSQSVTGTSMSAMLPDYTALTTHPFRHISY
jgi:hypothetical protein